MRWVKKPIAAQMKRAQTNMTYVVDGNKCANIVPQGQYFQLINSTIAGRSDGVYTASKAIPANEVIDNTYFNQTSPISEGAINKINNELASLNGKFSPALMSTDANDAIASGTYYLTGDCANRPADWCIMTVIAFNGETLSQTATSVITGKTYVRSKSVNGWTSWEELALNSKITTLYNGTATWTIPFDISKYDIVFFVNVYKELIIIDNPKTVDTEVYTQTSRYYSEEIPKVEFDYAFIVSSGGMYVDGNKCSQINYTASGVSIVTPNMDEFKLIKAYGLQF